MKKMTIFLSISTLNLMIPRRREGRTLSWEKLSLIRSKKDSKKRKNRVNLW